MDRQDVCVFVAVFFAFVAGFNVQLNQSYPIQIDNVNHAKFSQETYQEFIIYGNNISIAEGIGKSMLPSFKTNQTYILETSFNYSDIRVGDVVNYENNKGVLTGHRITWRNETHFKAKGDNNLVEDFGIFDITQIKGIVIAALY